MRWLVVMSLQVFLMGLSLVDITPTAQPSNSTCWNSGCESKKELTSRRLQLSQPFGHSKVTVPPLLRTIPALLSNSAKRRLDSRTCCACTRANRAPPLDLLTLCHGDPEVQGIDAHRSGTSSQVSKWLWSWSCMSAFVRSRCSLLRGTCGIPNSRRVLCI